MNVATKIEPAGYAMPKTYQISISELYLAAEAPKGVNLVVRDSGSGSPMTDEELKASIYHHGILQPLIYKVHDSKKYVIAGNRRLRLLRQIFSDALTSDVPAQNVDDFGDVHWRQVAIDTNLSLPPHAVERYEQIVLLSKDLKLSPEDARLRFGLTPHQFNQIMALGKMSPLIREKWKAGEIDSRTAQAFTLEPDAKEQERIYAKISKANQQWRNGRVDAHEVKSSIIPQNQRALGKLVAFVGIDTCKKAKIIKQEDLFSNDHVVSDAKALNKLVGDKIAGLKAALETAGWAWVKMRDDLSGQEYSYGTLEPAGKAKPTDDEAAELEQLKKAEEDEDSDKFADAEEEREALEETIKQRAYTEAQRKKSGCILEILNTGKLSISYGRTDPSESRSRSTGATSKSKPKKKAGDEPVLSNALAQRLSEQLEKAIREAMKSNVQVSNAALIAALASRGTVVDIKAGTDATYVDEKKRAAQFTSVFEGAYASSPEAQRSMLTTAAAEALSIVTFNAERDPLKDSALCALVGALNADKVNKAIAAAFDAADYFAGVSMPTIVAAVRCSIGDGAAAEVAKMKKGAAAEYATKHVPAKGWLPDRLRTEHYKGPVETAAKSKAPAKKAKVAKKAAKKKARK